MNYLCLANPDYPGGMGAVLCAFLWVVTVLPGILLTLLAWLVVLLSKSMPRAALRLTKAAVGIVAISLGSFVGGIGFMSYDFLVIRGQPAAFFNNLETSKSGALVLMILLFLATLTAHFCAKKKLAPAGTP